MKKILSTCSYIPLYLTLSIGILLTGCTPAPQPTPAPTESLSPPTETVSPSTTPLHKATKTKSPTPDLALTKAAYNLTNPPPTPTRTPVFDASGNVTWHPNKELIWWGEGPGDGSSYHHEDLILFWDGTLLQDGTNHLDLPYTTKLGQDEVCKLLNTAQKSGFFEDPHTYNFPFDGLGSGGITVNGWRVRGSGVPILSWTISGRPYYDYLFCRECPIPSESTIVRPGLANMYYFLKNYMPPSRQVATVAKLEVHITPLKTTSTQTWPLTSMSIEQLQEKCNVAQCSDPGRGVVIDGPAALEMARKIPSGSIFPINLPGRPFFLEYPSMEITYESAWPEAPEVPQDYTLTCNVNGPTYPLMPLNPQQKFWYYAPNGQWSAERVEGENKMRVVNITGYEKFYQYDPQQFGRQNIQVYPRFWSADGQFFYVNVLPGDYQPNISLVNSVGLQKIDVRNEKVSYVFIGPTQQTFSFNFSSSQKLIAYIRQEETPLKLVIVNASSGEEKSALISSADVPAGHYIAAGSIAWPEYDDDKLYLAAIYEKDGQRKTHILMVDPANLVNMKVIYTTDGEKKLLDAHICPMVTDWNTFCQTSVDLSTGKIQN
jgi:hypothetical protein